MTKLEAIQAAKQFRKDADELLQRMKIHRQSFLDGCATRQVAPGEMPMPPLPDDEPINDVNEVIDQHTLSIRDLESCIMRQGMALKYIGTPNPYPESKNPESSVVEPTADGLKM